MTEPLVAALDARYGVDNAPWCIYRAQGQWVVLLPGKTITGVTIEEALSNAVDYVPMPEIPRRPQEMQVDQFEPRKSGKCWHLYYGDSFCGVLKSRRECKKVAPKIAERSQREAQEWDSKFAGFLSKVEGTDFRYKQS